MPAFVAGHGTLTGSPSLLDTIKATSSLRGVRARSLREVLLLPSSFLIKSPRFGITNAAHAQLLDFRSPRLSTRMIGASRLQRMLPQAEGYMFSWVSVGQYFAEIQRRRRRALVVLCSAAAIQLVVCIAQNLRRARVGRPWLYTIDRIVVTEAR